MEITIYDRRFTRYNGNEYRLVISGKSEALRTTDQSKFDESFISYGNFYLKQISLDELSDIYDYQFSVFYDSHLEGFSEEWDLVFDSPQVIKENGVELSLLKDGKFDGWEMIDRSHYIKWVDNSELKGAKLRFTFYKKDGKEYSPPLIEEKEINVSELFIYNQHYRNM